MDDAIIAKHGMRRARAYLRAKPVMEFISREIAVYRFKTGRPHGLPPIYDLVDSLNKKGITAARGGPVTYHTVARAIKMMEQT